MLQKAYTFAFSWYCSLILSSALLGAAPRSFQAAAMGSADAAQAKIQSLFAAAQGNGWSALGSNSKSSVPDANPARVSGSQSSISAADLKWLSDTVATVDRDGEKASFSGRLCSSLGLTQNDQRADVKQREYIVGERKHILNSTHVRGHLDVFFFTRTANEGSLYLFNLDGVLEKAVHTTKEAGPSVIPNGTAKAEFDKEMTWWSEHYMDMPEPGNS